MMKVTLEIPNPRFHTGDFIHYTETWDLAGIDITCRIDSVLLSGKWSRCDDKPIWMQVDEEYYFVTVQVGCHGTEEKKLRPGMMLSPLISCLDKFGTKVDYDGVVWSPDTVENIGQRWDAFEG